MMLPRWRRLHAKERVGSQPVISNEIVSCVREVRVDVGSSIGGSHQTDDLTADLGLRCSQRQRLVRKTSSLVVVSAR
jgi:hypothetical protein